MHDFAFARGIHHTIADGRSIILDVTRNRYLSLPSSASETLVRWLAGDALDAHHMRRLDRLVDAGLLVRRGSADEPGVVPRRPNVAERDSLDVRDANVPRGLVVALIWEQLLVRAQLRLLTLHSLLDPLDGGSPRSEIVEPAAHRLSPQIVAAALQSTGPFLTAHDKCLSRAIAVRRLLQRNGMRSDLVFGVVGRPFKAHCWVQVDGQVLTDAVDHVQLFTPILTL